MQILEIIAKKRDKKELSNEEIDFFIQEYTRGNVENYQASAFLMAIYINGMSTEETAGLTHSMLHSGSTINFDKTLEYKVDKHSTGGVGDKTSLILAPICAALGLKVPMISGRGLGHTGGTLDKLESIPGFDVNLDSSRFKALVKSVGVCIISQSKDIVPADKKLYALRDVSATIPSKPLIVGSIMSKKLAEGIDTLVMDVKAGKAAFMETSEDAEELASMMIAIGKKLGKKVSALITRMDQPLGVCIGNSLEVIESVDILRGKCEHGQRDLRDLSFSLTKQMLLDSGKVKDPAQADKLILEVIENGTAFKKFQEMVEAQGGNPKSLENYSLLPTAGKTYSLLAKESGWVSLCDALKIAKACSIIGAGRDTLDTKLDHAVGALLKKKIGDSVQAGDTLLEVHYNDEEKFKKTISLFESAYKIENSEVPYPEVIEKVLS
ncbi:MAG: pyrimidine-nucleoside phosphorylase [Chlamydiales bacterium]|jgi:pyrimidine-nucleoside phosphorylase